jgi:hypothetical protein
VELERDFAKVEVARSNRARSAKAFRISDCGFRFGPNVDEIRNPNSEIHMPA